MLVRRLLRKLAIIGCCLLLLAAVVLFILSQHVPELYRQALTADRTQSKEMVRRAAALASDVKQEGRWQARFTAEQINAWLAYDLVEKHAGTLPEEFLNPRVAIKPDRMMLFCEVNQGGVSSVVTLTIEPYLLERRRDVLALRIRKARAGKLWFPIGRILEGAREAARESNVQLDWQQADGDQVALITIPPLVVDADDDGVDFRGAAPPRRGSGRPKRQSTMIVQLDSL